MRAMRREEIAGTLALALLVALFWSLHGATGGTELGASGDTVLYYYPQYAAAGASLRDGHLPFGFPEFDAERVIAKLGS
jgi:hypothetical protein